MGIWLYRKLSLKAALTLLTVRTPHRAILPWARYLQDRSPRSESICPVERPSSCDTGHNAQLATKGSVQQSLVDRPVYSEHARSHRDPVNPVTVYRPGPEPDTRYSVSPTTPGKQGTVTTPGRPITLGSPGSTG